MSEAKKVAIIGCGPVGKIALNRLVNIAESILIEDKFVTQEPLEIKNYRTDNLLMDSVDASDDFNHNKAQQTRSKNRRKRKKHKKHKK